MMSAFHSPTPAPRTIPAHRRQFRPILAMLLCALLFAGFSAQASDIDFGLPLFNLEEIRLEKTKAPDFNLSLLKKYLAEHQKNPLAQLHAMAQWVTLMKMSDTPRTAELEKLVLKQIATEKFSDETKAEGLRYLFLNGLLTAGNREPDPKNARDHAFEELLLKAEEPFERTPEYHLIKGILFQLLRTRPNNYFGPMKPFEDLKRAAALAPSDPHYYYVLGQAFRMLGSEEPSLFLAIASFEKASSLAPGNPKLQNTLLGIYMGLHEGYKSQAKDEPFWLQEAVYKKILTLSPNNPHALNNLGFLYAEYGVHRELAQSLVQRAVDQMPDNPGFRDSLGWAAFKNSQTEKAIQELEKAVAMSPDTYEPHYHLGTVYYVSKQHEKAIPIYEKAIALRPTSAEALNNYAYLLTELDRDLDKAEKMAARAVKIEPNNASYLDTYGWVLFKQGNTSEGLRLLQRAASIAPDVGEILMHLGKVHLQMAQFETAIEYFRQAIKADPYLENMQRDLYLAIVLRAQYRAVAEYHGQFGAKASPVHLNRILLQLVRIFQEEGMFDRAIEMTRLCEQLKRGNVDLAKPLFDYYTIELATATEAVTATPTESLPQAAGEEGSSEENIIFQESDDLDSMEPGAEGSDASEAAIAEGAEGSLEPVFPNVASVPLALNIGPAAASIAADKLLAFPEFGKLSATLFVKRLRKPGAHSILKIEYPGLEKRKALSVAGYHLSLIGCRISSEPVSIAGFPAIRTSLLHRPLWLIQAGNALLAGTGSEPSAEELPLLLGMFPYEANILSGIFIDWRLWEAEIPFILRAWVKNPLRPFLALYARHRLEGDNVTEVLQQLPSGPVQQKLMKEIADQLFEFKRKMLDWNIPVEVRVSANDGCVEMEATFGTFIPRVRDLIKSYKPLVWFLQPRFRILSCFARRIFFGRTPADLAKICPDGGTVTIDGPSGMLLCTKHPAQGFFPMLAGSSERCLYTRERLMSIIALITSKVKPGFQKEGLINKILMIYNMNSCPAGGKYTLNADGSIGCSEHPASTGRNP